LKTVTTTISYYHGHNIFFSSSSNCYKIKQQKRRKRFIEILHCIYFNQECFFFLLFQHSFTFGRVSAQRRHIHSLVGRTHSFEQDRLERSDRRRPHSVVLCVDQHAQARHRRQLRQPFGDRRSESQSREYSCRCRVLDTKN